MNRDKTEYDNTALAKITLEIQREEAELRSLNLKSRSQNVYDEFSPFSELPEIIVEAKSKKTHYLIENY